MGLSEFVKKINDKLDEGAKKFENALNNGINSADTSVNSGLDSLRSETDKLIQKSGVKDYVKEETPVVEQDVRGLSGLGEAEPNTSIGNIIRSSIGEPVKPEFGPNGEYSYGSVEDGMRAEEIKSDLAVNNVENNGISLSKDEVVESFVEEKSSEIKVSLEKKE